MLKVGRIEKIISENVTFTIKGKYSKIYNMLKGRILIANGSEVNWSASKNSKDELIINVSNIENGPPLTNLVFEINNKMATSLKELNYKLNEEYKERMIEYQKRMRQYIAERERAKRSGYELGLKKPLPPEKPKFERNPEGISVSGVVPTDFTKRNFSTINVKLAAHTRQQLIELDDDEIK